MLPPFCPNTPGMTDYRVEKDFLGELKVPKDAYWGAQTQRAIENFPISGIRFGRRFLYALGLIKMAAAQTNMELGLLDSKIGKAIVQACRRSWRASWTPTSPSTSSRPGAARRRT